VTALVRYVLSLLVRGQGYLAPVLLFVTALIVLTTNDQGALASTYSACALTQFVCMTWLTAALVNTEDPYQRAMTVVAAGGSRRVLVANVLAAALMCVMLTVVGLVYPVVAGDHEVTAAALATGVVAQLTSGGTGIAAGLLCSRLVIRRTGYAVLVGLGLIGVLVVVQAVPPVGPVMRLLTSDRPPERMLAPLAGYAAIAAALLLASTAATHALARR
jgi:hypothetical protein